MEALLLILLIVFFVFCGISLNKSEMLFEKYAGCFGRFGAHMYATIVTMGIAAIVVGIVSLITDLEDSKFGLLIIPVGILLEVLAFLVGISVKKKAESMNINGNVIGAMIIAGWGNAMRVGLKMTVVLAPLAAKAGERQRQEYIREREAYEAQQRQIQNSRVYNSGTGENYYFNSDGSMFRTPDGNWHSVNEVRNNDDLSIKHDR